MKRRWFILQPRCVKAAFALIEPRLAVATLAGFIVQTNGRTRAICWD